MMKGAISITYPLSMYVRDGCLWARFLSVGLSADCCRACTLRRLWVAASIMDVLALDPAGLPLILSQLQPMISAIGLDAAWLQEELSLRTPRIHAVSGLTGKVRAMSWGRLPSKATMN